ncbi:MAG: hypothetical protein ACLP8S_19780 [Solirubrobacteraceae bacterium]
MDPTPLTSTSLAAAAADVLERAGYRVAAIEGAWQPSWGRVYEDPYSIVAVAVFETWAALRNQWLARQSALAGLIAENFAKAEPKAWEGYLVLLTPSIVPSDFQVEATDIRRNTQHVRKLLGTGDEMTTLSDVDRILLPLLPLPETEGPQGPANALALLPAILSEHGIRRDAVETVIQAFTSQQPILERLHEHLAEDKTTG